MEGEDVLADYEYAGLYLNRRGLGGILDDTEHPDVVRLSFEGSGTLGGYDAWGRIIGLRHYKPGGSDIVKLEYGYSKGSDRLYQKNTVDGEGSQSELYAYDALHRLTSFKRGTLNATNDAITGTPVREQTWELDHLGNWTKITSKAGGEHMQRPLYFLRLFASYRHALAEALSSELGAARQRAVDCSLLRVSHERPR